MRRLRPLRGARRLVSLPLRRFAFRRALRGEKAARMFAQKKNALFAAQTTTACNVREAARADRSRWRCYEMFMSEIEGRRNKAASDGVEARGLQKADCDAEEAADVAYVEGDCAVEGRRCLNGGLCVRRADDSTFCKCAPPHIGTHCDKIATSDSQTDGAQSEAEAEATATAASEEIAAVDNPIGAALPTSALKVGNWQLRRVFFEVKAIFSLT